MAGALPTLDQLIEQTIFNVTHTLSPPPPTPLPSLAQLPFHPPAQNQLPFQPPPQNQFSFHPPPVPQPAPPPPRHAAPNLPQDILHILDSNFASDPSSAQVSKQEQLDRITEELRIKVRLSRYKRAQCDLSESDHSHSTSISESGSEQSEEDQVVSEDNKSASPSTDTLQGVLGGGSGNDRVGEQPDQQAISRFDPQLEIVMSNHLPHSPTSASAKLAANQDLARVPQEIQPERPAQKSLAAHAAVGAAVVDPGSLPQGPGGAGIHSTEAKPKTCRRKARSRAARRRKKESDHSDLDEQVSDGSESPDLPPTTVNELRSLPAEATEVPFQQALPEDLKTLTPFGTILSTIGSVVVIRGTPHLGYDKVLDEGSLVCREDGLVIGKIFETFGSVTEPHYSIRLPSQSKILDPSPSGTSPLPTGLPVYFLPRHAQFVFTAQLRAQPKGTDASNIYDEEIDVDEIEFSDDEAEAAFLRSRKLAKKASATKHKGPRAPSRAPGQRPESVLAAERHPRQQAALPNAWQMYSTPHPDLLNYNQMG